MPPWLEVLAAEALRTGDVLGACGRAGATLSDLYRARQASPEADALMVEVDQAVRGRARASVEALAASGDLRAIRALTDGTLAKLDGRPEPGEELPPHVAAAMLAAGVAAAEGREPWGPPPADPWAWWHANSPPPGYHQADGECPTCGRPPDRAGALRGGYTMVGTPLRSDSPDFRR